MPSAETSGPSQGFKGPLTRISCRVGRLGRVTPASRATSGLQAPQAFTTVSQRMRPAAVCTARMSPPRTSKPVTGEKVRTVAPRACAAAA